MFKNQSERDRMQDVKDLQKHYYDRNAKDIAPLAPGQRVRVQNDGNWEFAKVVNECAPRSYIIESPNGNRSRRNRVHLKDVHPTSQIASKSDNTNETVPDSDPATDNNVRSRPRRIVKKPNRLIEEKD
jgi:hypothetical protein